MKTVIETITPSKASTYLQKNKTNRPMRQSIVDAYALDMRKGHWVLNHQGIAFDINGNLIDGQHRLEAIRSADTAVKMLVTVGVDEKSTTNGLQVFSMDTVDRGKQRSVGDQLVLRHGCNNGALTAGVLAQIALLATNGVQTKLSVPSAVGILNLYKSEVEYAIANRSPEVGIRSAVVIGTAAFALKSDKDKATEFYKLLTSGEGLHREGPTGTVYAIRRHLQNGTMIGATKPRWHVSCAVANCIKHFCTGIEINQIKHTHLGVEWLIGHQKSTVAKVLEIVTV